MRVLQIGADRSKRGILYSGTPAFKRQEAYAKQFGNLDIIGFSLRRDGAQFVDAGALRIFPTDSTSKLFWGFDTVRVARTLARPDVVSVQDPFETGLVGWWIARKYKVPLHVQVHTDVLSPEYVRLSPLNRLRVLLAGFVLRRAAGIRVVSERIKKSVQAHYGINVPITVLPIFVDVERIRNAERDPELMRRFTKWKTKLLIVSRLEPEKDVALAIRAFARSAPADACLIVVGEGSEWPSLEDIAQECGISKRVLFEGARDAAQYYPLVDLVLFPSRYEGYGMVIIEALVAGKPVLSTDVGIAREAGAIVTIEEKFAGALAEWFKSGPRTGTLNNYPYANFDEYVRAYCDDIASCVKAQKGHTTAI